MKTIRMLTVIALCSFLWVSQAYAETVRVRPYMRQDGTIVSPHMRTAPNSSRDDNFSTKGNINPYTGKQGTVDPYDGRSGSLYAPTYPNGGQSIYRSPYSK